MDRTVVYLDGSFVSPEEARVSVVHRGYLHGDGVFATMHGYGGVCFRAARHLAMLERGRTLLALAAPAESHRIAELADDAATRTGAEHAYVRVTIGRGVTDAEAVLSILARPLAFPSERDFEEGVAATVVSLRRVPPACMDSTIKTSSYAPQLLAKREADARGAYEGIQLAIDGSVACGTTSNVFAIVGERLLTPPPSTGCREGVTREAILERAREDGIDVAEAPLSLATLVGADEVFFTSTRVECLSVATIDGQTIGTGRYPRTRVLREGLRAAIAHETRGNPGAATGEARR